MTIRFTIAQAAAELGTKTRFLAEWLRKHPRDERGVAYYMPAGRDKVLRQGDIDRIEIALREEVSCPSHSGRRGKAKRPTSKSAAPIEVSQWKQAADLLNDPSLIPSSNPSLPASTNTDAGRRQKPNLHLVTGSRHS